MPSEKSFNATKREQRKLDHIYGTFFAKRLKEQMNKMNLDISHTFEEDENPVENTFPSNEVSKYGHLSSKCARLREAMLDSNIGLDRLGDMVGYPELVIDTAIEYFESLPDQPERDDAE